jgi:hypothetical protein
LAVTDHVAAGLQVTVLLAAPLFKGALPLLNELRKKLTSSPLEGVPLTEVTAALSVRGSPKTDGFGVGTGVSVVVV